MHFKQVKSPRQTSLEPMSYFRWARYIVIAFEENSKDTAL